MNDAFGKKKAQRKVEIMPWSPHRDGDALLCVSKSKPDFQRLLDGE